MTLGSTRGGRFHAVQWEVGEDDDLVQAITWRTGQMKSSFFANRNWLGWWPLLGPTGVRSRDRNDALDQATKGSTSMG